MTDKKIIKARIIELTNAYYTSSGIKKTVSEDNWVKVLEPCSDEDAESAAEDICRRYGVVPPGNALELASKGLDAVAAYFADPANADALSGGKYTGE